MSSVPQTEGAKCAVSQLDDAISGLSTLEAQIKNIGTRLGVLDHSDPPIEAADSVVTVSSLLQEGPGRIKAAHQKCEEMLTAFESVLLG